MTSPIFKNDEVNLLHALRSRSINVKNNFSSLHRNDMSCPLCYTGIDDQQHILDCDVLKKKMKTNEAANNKVVYEDIFADYRKPKEATHLFAKLLKIRNTLVDKNLCWITAPSNSAEMLEDHDNLRASIVHYPFGK